jgi:hypothetical protein
MLSEICVFEFGHWNRATIELVILANSSLEVISRGLGSEG